VQLDRYALVVVDVQRGFDEPVWGPRNNPGCERKVSELIEAWRSAGRPIVFVRHDSAVTGSPLAPGEPGHALKDEVHGRPDLLVTKQVNSAFYGEPDLDAWLRERRVEGIVVCGITTDHCCSTTARMAANLGHRVLFVDDATATFDREAPDGTVIPAEEVHRVSLATLHGEFADVVRTADLTGAND
jgi:nicotinamidase-related amidase